MKSLTIKIIITLCAYWWF